MQPVILVVCDGMPDRPIKELGNKTPLEVANTPNLDKIAVDGISGMMHTVDVGVRPGSDTAHLALFGYDPAKYYTGRGPFECAGINMELKPGDIAFRANAATLDHDGKVIDRRAGRIDSTQELVDYLGEIEIEGVKIILKPGLSHRIGMILRGENLSDKVSKRDPKATGVEPFRVEALDDSLAAETTAKVLNQFADLVTAKLKTAPFNQTRLAQGQPPANTILFRGAGVMPSNIEPFEKKYKIKAAVVAGGPLYKGIARVLGMDVIDFKVEDGITGKFDSNLDLKIKTAIELTKKYDFIFVHIKAADSFAEDGDYQGKIKFIEKTDQALKPLADSSEFLVVITADHTTSSTLKNHTADPVPVTIKGDGVRTDDLSAYTERECAKGRLGSIRGGHLMPIIVDLLGQADMYGA